MAKRRVAVTGLGPVSAIGIGKEAFWSALCAGTVGIDRISAFDPSKFGSQIGGEIKGLRCLDYVPKWYRKSVKVMARDIEVAVMAANCAVRDSRLGTKGINDGGEVNIDPTRLGVNIGAGLICPDLTELAEAFSTSSVDGQLSLELWGQQGMKNLTPLWLLKYLPNMLACHVSILHDAQAPSNTITCAEAASHLAIGEAYRTILRGAADVCLCGGAESKLNPMGVLRQDIVGRLSRKYNDSPGSAVRPFDADRDGTAVAEGGAVIVLEELDHARKRGATIYCELIGHGTAFGTHDFIHPDATGRPYRQALERALADGGISADQVSLVHAFACGLREHDQVEANAVTSLLGEVPVTSIKGQVGNSGAGAGALDVAAAALSVSQGFIPRTINFEKPDSDISANVVRKSQKCELNVVVSLGYSLGGGQVGALAFRRWNA